MTVTRKLKKIISSRPCFVALALQIDFICRFSTRQLPKAISAIAHSEEHKIWKDDSQQGHAVKGKVQIWERSAGPFTQSGHLQYLKREEKTEERLISTLNMWNRDHLLIKSYVSPRELRVEEN